MVVGVAIKMLCSLPYCIYPLSVLRIGLHLNFEL